MSKLPFAIGSEHRFGTTGMAGTDPAVAVPVLRRLARRLLRSPVLAALLRPLLPGWPDAGRRIVQGPMLRALLVQAGGRQAGGRLAVNAGSGEGLFTRLICESAAPARLVQFDLNPRPTGDLRETRVHAVAASITNVPLATGSANLIVCTEVLEHVPDDSKAVGELRRLLADGGWLVLSVPTPPAEFDPAHVREGYTQQELTTLLERHGFSVVAWQVGMYAGFRRVLRRWRPGRMPRLAIECLAWFDRLLPLGPPMNVAVLARAAGPEGS